MVVETAGACIPEAHQALELTGEAVDLHVAASGPTLLQECSVLVRTWRARASLRRRAELDS